MDHNSSLAGNFRRQPDMHIVFAMMMISVIVIMVMISLMFVIITALNQQRFHCR
ncbi:hypothetical protein SRABI106_04744 [Rahnella aquatilis]|nr:hypothetical protein SRABI106_04744 [Rahnella aquatilis]